MNVLIVDDEIVQVETIGRGLRSRGYAVCFALNGEDALDKLSDSSRKIDMVITDYAMPEMNGLTLLRNIRQRYRSLPVIMMTAYADKALVIDALRNRCESFIEKPFTLDQLIQEIARADVSGQQAPCDGDRWRRFPKHLHQMNNPLISIVGSAELAMHKLSDRQTIEKCIRRILGSAEKISEINESFIKADPGPLPARGVIDLKALVNDCLNMFQDLLTLKEISVVLTLAEGVRVQGNRFGLEQVFKNLILNAVDALEGRDEKQLTLRSRLDSERKTVQIQVDDTGCGIGEPLLGKLFTPYFSSKPTGNGIGLTVVRNIVEQHRGAVSVRSRENEGTTFSITLPLAPASLPSRSGLPYDRQSIAAR